MCGETEVPAPHPRWSDADYLPRLSQQGCLGIEGGAQAVSLRINHSPGHIVGPFVIWQPVTLLLLLPWIQPGWSKSQTSGEAGTGGVHWTGLGVLGNTGWAAHSLGVPS